VRTPKLGSLAVRIVAVPLVAAVMAGSALAGSASARTASPRPDHPARPDGSLPANTFLFGASAKSARDAWTVGQVVTTGKTVTLHWNGHGWKRVPSPTPTGSSALYAVAAVSARDAWAVGGSDNAPYKTVILHWNGSTWKQEPTPAVGGALFGVAATSASNAWAVGCAGDCYNDFAPISTLVLHWNGTAWKRVPSPSPGLGSTLTSVAATSAKNAWAVGCSAFCEISSAAPQTVILRWNGTNWLRVPSPASAAIGALNGVTATSANRAWAVGCTGHCFGPGATTHTLILGWNGTGWSKVASPSPGNSVLAGVTAISPSFAWAVGYARVSNKTLILRWNGHTWKQVPSPTPKLGGQLLAVAAASTHLAWAVGSSFSGVIVLQQWNGTAWK
jgi:hypothetical protein